jgi:hypothetical protein
MNFLYFIPGAGPTIDHAGLVAAGLGYAFDPDTPRLARGVVGAGPDGASAGLIICAATDLGGVEYRPDRQTWRNVPGTAAWVGLNTDARPGPADLARAGLLAGHPVRLGDGRVWQAPTARGYEERGGELALCGKLPWRTRVDDAGKWVSELAERYRPLWDTACAFWDAFTAEQIAPAADAEEDGRRRFEFAESNDAALLALAVNYRLGKAEVDLLGLFNQQTVTAVLLALVDWPTLRAFAAKKAAPAGSPG